MMFEMINENEKLSFQLFADVQSCRRYRISGIMKEETKEAFIDFLSDCERIGIIAQEVICGICKSSHAGLNLRLCIAN